MTKRFITYSAKTVFWLSVLLGIPGILWIYSVGIEINKRLDSNDKISTLLIKLLFGYTITWVFVGPMVFLITMVNSGDIESLLPWHFAAMFSISLLLVIDAILLARIEQQYGLPETGIVNAFFKMWFYPFGIWTLQPRINKYAKLKIIK